MDWLALLRSTTPAGRGCRIHALLTDNGVLEPLNESIPNKRWLLTDLLLALMHNKGALLEVPLPEGAEAEPFYTTLLHTWLQALMVAFNLDESELDGFLAPRVGGEDSLPGRPLRDGGGGKGCLRRLGSPMPIRLGAPGPAGHSRPWSTLRDAARETQYDRDGSPLAVADFYYRRERVVVFVDGSPHHRDYVQAADERKRQRLKGLGYRVLVAKSDELEKGLDALALRAAG